MAAGQVILGIDTMPRLRLITILAAAGAATLLLSGCVLLKPGSYSLTQPTGIGAAQLKFGACSIVVNEPEPEKFVPECGPQAEPEQGQMLLGLVVPSGTATPNTIAAVPGPGATATTFSRSSELAARMGEAELTEGSKGPPVGFEIAAYISGVVAESSTNEVSWSMEAGLGFPAVADGGSYGGPFAANVVLGWRNVTAIASSSRPINCKESGPEPESGQTFCGSATNESPIGVSDLKIRPSASAKVVPGERVNLPFVLDFASSAAELPKFKLALSSTLAGAELRLSNSAFTRAPTNSTTKRAPATTRKAMVKIPTTAALGDYELTLSATANKGGVATGVTILSVAPKGRAKVTVPKLFPASRAVSRGVPVTLYAPIAATRFTVVLKGPKRLAKKKFSAKGLGFKTLKLRVPSSSAAEALATGRALRLKVKVRQPGLRKPLRLTRLVNLR